MKHHLPALLTLLLFAGAAGAFAAPDGSVSSTAAESATSAGKSDVLGAVGIGVSDLETSTAFYQQVLGLEVLRTYELGYINEVVLGYPGTAATVLVLMNWPGDVERRYDGSDVKIVFYVSDPEEAIQRIRALGGKIDREATPHEAVDGLLVGLGRDPDNYVVEVVQR